MLNIGPAEVLVILVVALLILGPTKLPEAARQIGKAMSEFRRVTAGLQDEVRNVLDDHLDTTKGVYVPPPAVEATDGLPPVATGAEALEDGAAAGEVHAVDNGTVDNGASASTANDVAPSEDDTATLVHEDDTVQLANEADATVSTESPPPAGTPPLTPPA